MENISFVLSIFAGWLRYLLAVDDEGKPFELSPDPLLDEVVSYVKAGSVEKILSNEKIFGVNLYEVGLAEKVLAYFTELNGGTGAVRATLKKYTGEVVKQFEKIGIIPEDTGIITSTNKGEPIVNDENALAGKAYRNVAQRILGEEVPFLDLDEPKGFMAKIKNAFAKLKVKV